MRTCLHVPELVAHVQGCHLLVPAAAATVWCLLLVLLQQVHQAAADEPSAAQDTDPCLMQGALGALLQGLSLTAGQMSSISV